MPRIGKKGGQRIVGEPRIARRPVKPAVRTQWKLKR
jgi:hypothetical protein